MSSKKFSLPLIFISCILLFGLTSTDVPGGDEPFAKEWKEVDELMQKRRPQSAMDIVDRIYAQARQQQLIAQEIKAASYKCQLWDMYEEEPLIKGIEFVKAAAKDTNPVAKSLYDLMLAGLYKSYAESNSYRLMKQQISGEIPEDLRFWNAAQFAEQVKKLSLQAIDKANALQNLPVEEFRSLLTEEDSSDVFRPTLYDIVAFQAIDLLNFSSSFGAPGPSGIKDPEKLMAPLKEFLAIGFNRQNTVQAQLAVYQDILKFHNNSKNIPALLDADLHRLHFIQERFSSVQRSLYLSALETMVEEWQTDKYVAEVKFELARAFSETSDDSDDGIDQNNIRAMEICNKLIRDYSGSRAAQNAAVLKGKLLEKSLNIETEHACLPGDEMPVEIHCRNLDTLWLKIYKVDRERLLKTRDYSFDRKDMIRISKDEPLKKWQIQKGGIEDYTQVTLKTFLPELPKGLYVLMVSEAENLTASKNAITSWTDFWLTELAFVAEKNDNDYTIITRNRQSGAVLSEVDIELLPLYGNSKNPVKYVSNKSGRTKAKLDSRSSYKVFLTKGDDAFLSQKNLYKGRSYESVDKPKTWFFTDRAIYRPGQQVFFKAITTQKEDDSFKLLTEHKTKIIFYDVNHKVIGEKELVTNEYGAVDGSFHIPEGLLNGSMSLRNEYGSHSIRVEEYKRPTFEVLLQQPKTTLKLGEEVVVKGEAKTFNQLPVENSTVRYRVERVEWTPFYWFYMSPNAPEEIASGESQTDADGNFEIPFIARKSEFKTASWRNYQFRVFVDVVTPAGETRSDEINISIGDQLFFLKINAPQSMLTNELSKVNVRALNLNEEAVVVSAKIELYSLTSENGLARPSLFSSWRTNYRDAKGGYQSDIAYRSGEKPDFIKEKQLFEAELKTGKADDLQTYAGLDQQKAGMYRIIVSSVVDGKTISDSADVLLINPKSRKMPYTDWSWFYVHPDKELQPGDVFTFFAGSSKKDVLIAYEIRQDDKIIKKDELKLHADVKKLEFTVEESWRGNVSLHAWFICENRIYTYDKLIKIPWSNKKLDIKTITFRDKMKPGAKESWSFHISGPDGQKLASSVLAGMYDRSLDVFATDSWNFVQYPFYRLNRDFFSDFGTASSVILYGSDYRYQSYLQQRYDKLNFVDLYFGGRRVYYRSKSLEKEMPVALEGVQPSMAGDEIYVAADEENDKGGALPPEPKRPKEITPPAPRTNLNETAFFYPDIRTDEKGDVLIEFTAPEALTAWKFRMMAYTKDLETAMTSKEAITTKELMVFPNLPRFLREGDEMEFPALIRNKTDEACVAKAWIQIVNPVNGKDITDDVLKSNKTLELNMEAHASAAAAWKLKVPEAEMPLQIAVFAETEKHQDGEQKIVPVLTNRVAMTESMPIYVNPGQEKEIELEKWYNSLKKQEVEDFRLTLEFTGNPAWYAIQALPGLAQPSYESVFSLANAYYATAVSSHIAHSSPRIQQVIETWKNLQPDALLSQLQKNEELKSVLLKETPWVLEAENDHERKLRLATLFDLNTVSYKMDSWFNKLADRQNGDGGFSWFDGMESSPWNTINVMDKLLRLREMDVELPVRSNNIIRSAMTYLDREMIGYYQKMKERKSFDPEKYEPSPNVIAWLEMKQTAEKMGYAPRKNIDGFDEVYEFFKARTLENCFEYSIYMQAKIANWAFMIGESKTANELVRSIRERALHSDEMGMYWRHAQGWFWYSDGVGQQVKVIELFTKNGLFPEEVEQMKVWLLKQKQTGSWRSNSNTADACYALLMTGTKLLEDEDNLKVSLKENGTYHELKVQKEAGTGYFKKQWSHQKVDHPQIEALKATNSGKVPSWGAAYLSFMVGLDKAEAHESPMSIDREYFLESASGNLTPLEDGMAINPGDRVVVRLSVETDRKLEYVHIRDYHAAGLEQESSRSGYFWNSGTGYYLDMKDATANFFVYYLSKGMHQFEYTLIAAQKGNFSNGFASAQCLYAPEFAAHSKGNRVEIK